MFCKVARPAQAQPWPFRLALLPAVLGGRREKPPGCPGERRQPGGPNLLLFQIIPKPRAAPDRTPRGSLASAGHGHPPGSYSRIWTYRPKRN